MVLPWNSPLFQTWFVGYISILLTSTCLPLVADAFVTKHVLNPSPAQNTRQFPFRIGGAKKRVGDVTFPLEFSSQVLLLADVDLSQPSDIVPPFAMAAVALILGISAQGFIYSMLQGEQGLGAFLSDGSGYSGSKFKPRSGPAKSQDDSPLSGGDPLPWLKLPQLNFVEVAGQQESSTFEGEVGPLAVANDAVLDKLETLRNQVREELEAGDTQKARIVQDELEKLMKESGYEFRSD